MSPAHVMIMTTAPSRETAEALAEALLAQRLAACVQLAAVESRYVWEGRACAEPEVLLLIKTRAALWSEIEAALSTLHPYATPELIATPILFGSAAFLAWIDARTAGG